VLDRYDLFESGDDLAVHLDQISPAILRCLDDPALSELLTTAADRILHGIEVTEKYADELDAATRREGEGK